MGWPSREEEEGGCEKRRGRAKAVRVRSLSWQLAVESSQIQGCNASALACSMAGAAKKPLAGIKHMVARTPASTRTNEMKIKVSKERKGMNWHADPEARGRLAVSEVLVIGPLVRCISKERKEIRSCSLADEALHARDPE